MIGGHTFTANLIVTLRCLQVSRMAFVVFVMLASFQLLAQTQGKERRAGIDWCRQRHPHGGAVSGRRLAVGVTPRFTSLAPAGRAAPALKR
jgi:hypothetical protein